MQPSIPRFDGHYDHWSMLMENLLHSKEFWGLVETDYVEPPSESVQMDAQRKKIDDLKLKDLKVKNYLFQAIDRIVLHTILKKDIAKDIWDAMKKKFKGNARVKKSHLQALRREFETLEMKSNEGVIRVFFQSHDVGKQDVSLWRKDGGCEDRGENSAYSHKEI